MTRLIKIPRDLLRYACVRERERESAGQARLYTTYIGGVGLRGMHGEQGREGGKGGEGKKMEGPEKPEDGTEDKSAQAGESVIWDY